MDSNMAKEVATTIFGQFSQELVTLIADSWLIFTAIALASVLITQAVKMSYENALIKKKLQSVPSWIINIAICFLFSGLVIFVFDGKETITETIGYWAFLFCLAWATSVVAYDVFIKIIFDAFSTIKNKAKILKIDSEVSLLEASNTLLKQKILNKELLKEYEDKKLLED